MSDAGTSKELALSPEAHARRSTRVFLAVPLSISGKNRTGNLFLESTSAVSVNCHGCLYPSRHEYRQGSWVTIEVPNQQVNSLPRPVRAQVKFVRLPSSPQELYLVGVELESPANVWGIKGAPDDWLQFSTSANAVTPAITLVATPEPAGGAAHGPSELDTPALPKFTESRSSPGAFSDDGESALESHSAGTANSATGTALAERPGSAPAIPPEQLLQLMEGTLQKAAEKAVAAVLTSRFTTCVTQAVKAIEKFSQANLRQVEARSAQYLETLLASAREDLLGRMKTDCLEAGEDLRSQVRAFSSSTLETMQRLEQSAASVRPLVETAQASLRTTATEVQDHVSTHVRELAEQALSGFNEEAARQSQRQLARLTEKAHASSGEAARAIDARSGEARLLLESSVGAALGEFHERAGIEIDLAVSDSRKSIEATLQSIAAAACADADERQRASQQELTRATDQGVEQFRQRLAGILNSSLIAAMSAVNEHSSTLLQALVKETEAQKSDLCVQEASRVSAD